VSALRGARRAAGAWDLQSSALIAAGAVLAVLAGVAAAHAGHASLEVCAALVALAAVVWLTRRYGSGVVLGLIVLAAVDALPGPNMETLGVVRTLTASDVLVLILAATLVLIAIKEGTLRHRVSAHELVLRGCAAALLLLWLIGGIRAWIGHAVPIFNGLFWGREYLYLAVLPPLFVRALVVDRVRTAALVTCGVGICVVSLTQVITVVTGNPLSLFVHLTLVGDVQGLIRLYSGADWLIPAGVPFGLGLLLFDHGRRQRLAGSVVLAFSLAAVAAELTRALYVGMVIGIALTAALWFAVGDPTGRIGRRRGFQVVAVLAAMGAALVFFRPAVVTSSAVNGVVVRATSVFSDLSTGGSLQDPDLAARRIERSDLTEYLGRSWLFGKGFLDPTYAYVPQVVGGSIMNPDVGYLSAEMTLGVVGLIAVYLPFVYLALVIGYLRLQRRPGTSSWIAFGSLASLVTAIASSVTLAAMLNPVGAVAAGAFLSLACISVDRAAPKLEPVRQRYSQRTARTA
jgi:hypothetical protein